MQLQGMQHVEASKMVVIHHINKQKDRACAVFFE